MWSMRREHAKSLVFKINEWFNYINITGRRNLKQSQNVAEECNKYSVSKAYDLAIAKVAMQLQAEDMSSSIMDR